MAAGAGGSDRVARLTALDALLTMPCADQLDEARAALVISELARPCFCLGKFKRGCGRQLVDDDPRFEDAEDEETGEQANSSHPPAPHQAP